MKIKTYKGILAKVHDALGRGNVVKHTPTKENTLGQSGFHTLTDDIMNIVEEAIGDSLPPEKAGDVYKGIAAFLQQLDQFETKDTQGYCPKCMKVGDKCQCK